MKTITKLLILSFIMMGITACYTSIPLKVGESENNTTYQVVISLSTMGAKYIAFMTEATMSILRHVGMLPPSRTIRLRSAGLQSIEIRSIQAITN